ncbi:MAG: DUF3820 family protein [Granulosicoccaceae bacterium]
MTLDLDMLSEEVLAAAALPMPFGRFKGTPLIDLPEPYVVWFKQQGFPNGHLGRQMALIYEIKANGLEKLLRPVLAVRKQQAAIQEPPKNKPPTIATDE